MVNPQGMRTSTSGAAATSSVADLSAGGTVTTAALAEEWLLANTFDLAGRVFKNKPAPTNLEIPPHRFVDADHLVIGESDAA